MVKIAGQVEIASLDRMQFFIGVKISFGARAGDFCTSLI